MTTNPHPLAMFEIMAEDQEKQIAFYNAVFGWHTEKDNAGFAYIHFPASPPASYPILGGIGKAQPGVPGYEKGTAFYIRVESVSATLERVKDFGGQVAVPSTPVDSYTFGMFYDPESNLIGLIEPFTH